jgi:hypothetical protein
MPAMHPTRTVVSAILTVVVTCASCVSSTPASEVPSATDAGSTASSPSPSRSNGILTASASPPFSSLTGGGPLAVLVVERMSRTPFRTRVEVRATTVTRTDSGTATVDGTETGVINDQDFDLQIETTSSGVVSQAHVVVIGDTVYVKVNKAAWQVSDRANAIAGIEAGLREIRRTLNAGDLADLGAETLDGQTVHHLTMTAPGAIHDPRNPLIVYDAYELWTLSDGSPVRRREATHVSEGSLTSTYTSETRYTGFGEPITIVAPKVPRSPRPSPP